VSVGVGAAVAVPDVPSVAITDAHGWCGGGGADGVSAPAALAANGVSSDAVV
jgi:hypothetical protein